MEINKRGRKLGLTVEPFRENLDRARNIPAPISWSGNVALFDPRPEAIAYIAETWPGIQGLDKLLKNIKLPTCTASTEEFKLKMPPFEHQKDAFKKSWQAKSYAWLMEMGTGKTYVGLLNAAWLAKKGAINGLLIIAPSGVHRKWINKEVPEFWPDGIPYKAAFWASTAKKVDRDKLEKTLNFDGMAIVAINTEAFSSSQRAKAVAKGFLSSRVVMCVLDESTDIKTPGKKRSMSICRLGKSAKYRRIMTGSPGMNHEIYGQFAFLGKELLGYTTYEGFKTDFATMVTIPGHDGKPIRRRGREVLTIAKDKNGKPKFKNTDRLRELMAPHCYRVTKKECFDLPEKTMEPIPIKLSTLQKKHYQDIYEECYTEFHGKDIETPLVIQKFIRLRQIVSGWLPVGEGEVEPIGNTNVKLERISRLIDEIEGKVVLWGNFKHECHALVDMLTKKCQGEDIACYWGDTAADDRERGVNDFQKGNTRFFVGSPACGGRGLDLFAASTMIFMSNTFSWIDREQAEDRIHRNGQEADKVTYLDVYAEGTIDEYIIKSLHAKKEICREVTGDHLLELAQPGW